MAEELITTESVKERMIMVRGQYVLLDRDVALLYGVETKHVNQAVKNNPMKFPDGYVFPLQHTEIQQLVKNFDRFASLKHSVTGWAFTEKGLYMLATILKSKQATETTIAIIETFTMMRELARNIEKLQDATLDDSKKKKLLLQSGKLMAEAIGANLTTKSVETEIEINLAAIRIKHKIIRTDKEDGQ